MASMARPKVVVVGAGISGVVAALQLQKSNAVDVVLLEASQRVGGRIWSCEFGGEKIEMGANWIHGTHGSPVMKIAEKHGLLDGGVGPWGGTRWTGGNSLRLEGGSEIDDEFAKEVKGIYRKAVGETLVIGSKETGQPTYLDKNGHEVGVDESVGAYLNNEFLKKLCSNRKSKTGDNCTGVDNGTTENWEDDWAGAEALSEPGRGAIAYQTSESMSAGLRNEAVVHTNGNIAHSPTVFSTEKETEFNEKNYLERIDWSNDVIRKKKAVFDMRTRLECCISGVDSLECLSSRSFGEYEEYPGPHITIASGYSRVVEILASQLQPRTLLFNQEVTQIQWSPPENPSFESQEFPVTVVTSEGVRFSANHVVVTVSLGVLKEQAAANFGAANLESKNLFCPELPEWKLEAIRRMGFGTVDKVFLQFPKVGVWGENALGLEVAWDPIESETQKNCPLWHGVADGFPPLVEDPTAEDPFVEIPLVENPTAANESVEYRTVESIPVWTRKLYAFHPINVRSPVIVTWLAGREAVMMEQQTDEKVMEDCMNVIARFLPEPERSQLVQPTAVLRSQWGLNPLFRGSYSYVAVGSSGDDIDILARPLPDLNSGLDVSELGTSENFEKKWEASISKCPLQILFAGEATHRYSYSNTHGAFHAGVREAQRILKLYGLTVSSLADDVFTQ